MQGYRFRRAQSFTNTANIAAVDQNDPFGNNDAADAVITVSSVANTAPTISAIADQVAFVNTVMGPVAFTIGDAETDPDSLALSTESSNPTLVPTIILGGSGTARSVTITPTAGMMGTATITITVSDGELAAYDVFELTVELYRIYLPLVLKND